VITDAALRVVFTVVAWIISAIPAVTWPAWLATGTASSASFSTVPGIGYWIGVRLGDWGYWVNVDLLLTVVALFVPVAVGLAAYKGVRALVSLVSGGGGS
jgi:hypothetical protein